MVAITISYLLICLPVGEEPAGATGFPQLMLWKKNGLSME
jgi:hypothetical protein